MSSDSGRLASLENIIVPGKGVIHWSERYKTHMYCVAGIACSGEWVRMYPLRLIDRVQPFDIVDVEVQKLHPEPYRTESVRVYPESLKVVGRITSMTERLQIIKDYTDAGDLLHGDGWKRQSIGMIKLVSLRFEIEGDNVFAIYECDCIECDGHRSRLEQFVKVDEKGRKKTESSERVQGRCNRLVGTNLRFLMGTHARYPYRWLLIGIHILEDLKQFKSSIRGYFNAN